MSAVHSAAAQRRRTPGLLRITAILEACAAGPQTFRELTGALDGLSASTLSRHLRQLVTADFLRREGDGCYRLGPDAVALGMALIGKGAAGRGLQEEVAALARETGESSAYFERQGDRAVLVAKQEVPERFHFIDLFDFRPLVAGMFGAVILGLLPPAEGDALIRRAGRTLTAARLERLRQQLAMLRSHGHISEEESGVWRLGVPVLREGQVCGVVAVNRPGVPEPAQARRLLACALAARQRLARG